MRIVSRASTALLLLLSVSGFAAAQAPSARRPAPKSAYGIVWQPTLEAALAVAKESKKPILLLRMLGELEGPC